MSASSLYNKISNLGVVKGQWLRADPMEEKAALTERLMVVGVPKRNVKSQYIADRGTVVLIRERRRSLRCFAGYSICPRRCMVATLSVLE